MSIESEEPEGKCHQRQTGQNIPPLFQNGNVVFQVHHVGWIVSGFFAFVACVVSFWLINKHLTWYTNKREQRHIVRLLFMVPIYAVISFASYVFWNTATPLILIRDGYESIVLASFFYLLLLYVSNDYDEQKLIFLKVGISKEADMQAIKKGEEVQKWCWPLGFVKSKPKDGLYFLQLMKWAILQYSVLRPATTLAAVILEYAGLYCETKWGPQWGHIYILVIVSLSVTVAMYCLIQLYIPVAERLKPHRPLLKLFSVKAVVFLTFWQASFLSFLSMLGVVKDGKYMTAEQINIGFGALLQTFEMMLFSILHLRAFTYRPYRPERNAATDKGDTRKQPSTKDDSSNDGRTPRLRSLLHAMNFYETFREIWHGYLYMYDRVRGREPRFDASARRAAHLEGAFGMTRNTVPRRAVSAKEARHGSDKLDYLLEPVTTRGSERFSEEIEKELQQGVDPDFTIHGHRRRPAENFQDEGARQPHKSWWRHAYTRVSQSNQEPEENILHATTSRHKHNANHSPRAGPRKESSIQIQGLDNYTDPPPHGLPHSRSRPLSRNDGIDTNDLAPRSLLNMNQRRTIHQPKVQDDQVSRPPTTQSKSKDSVLGRIFPDSDTTSSSLGHFQSTAPHSAPSESRHGHSSSKWKTPRPSFVPYSVPTENASFEQRPIVQSITALQAEVVSHQLQSTTMARTSHRRQSAEASPSTSPRSRQYSLAGRPGSGYVPDPRPSLGVYPQVPHPTHRRMPHMPRVLTVPAPLAQQNSIRVSLPPHEAGSVGLGYVPNHRSSSYSVVQR